MLGDSSFEAEMLDILTFGEFIAKSAIANTTMHIPITSPKGKGPSIAVAPKAPASSLLQRPFA